MRISGFLILLTPFLWNCAGSREEPHASLSGTWSAKWRTLPESYPGITGLDFTMNGVITFYEDSAAISAYGYKGCIFTEDTLSHSLRWKLSNDSLYFINDHDAYGLTYKVTAQEENKVELMLLQDIFLTLERQQNNMIFK